jgi:hypothetical protein
MHIVPSSDYRFAVQASLNFVIAITFIVSSFFVGRIKKLPLIYTSSLTTLLLTLLLFVPNDVFKVVILFVIGIFFSLGILGFLTFLWDITVPEERGRISGFVGFIALPLNFIVTYLLAPNLDFLGTIMLGVIINSGILLIALLRPEKTMLTAKKNERKGYFEKRTVLLYLIPWIIFSLVNVTLAKTTSVFVEQQVASSFYLFLLGLQFVGVVLGCIIGGTVADFFGRRYSLAFSLSSYGISAALIGIFASNEVLLLVYLLNGLSWGILFILYTFVVWGDLANKFNCPKMYSLGLTTYYLTIGIGLLTQISIPVVISSLATCLLVFLCNVPIVLAPELLSPYFRERMRIKLHINAVKKISKKSKDHGR